MTCRPGLRSLYALRGIHPELRRAVDYVYANTPQDLTVITGRRSAKEQEAIFAAGGSRTLDSRHLTGHAVDFAPYIAGSGLSWSWPLFFPVAETFRRAARELGIPLRWGGVWDQPLANLPGDLDDEHAAYIRRFKLANPKRTPLYDGGHIELLREAYP